MYITYVSRMTYLIFLVHLLHHLNFQIAAGVYLVEITRQYFTAAQLILVGDIKPHFPSLDDFLLGRMFV